MSFLLDALRKSERSGRRREAPTIHSNGPGSGEVAADAPQWPVFALSILAFAIMCWWTLDAFEVDLRPRVSGPDRSLSGEQSSPASGQPAGSPASVAAPGGDRVSSATEANTDSRDDSEPRRRTPVEQVARQPDRDTSPQPVARVEQDAESANRSSASAPERRVSSPTASTTARARDSAPRDSAPERRNFIDYWDLPDNVRSGLPEFRISVLVYAERPEDRFLLMNGQRVYEGDSPQQGLVLEEIRREGAIFSYRRYRFLVTS